MLIDEFLCKREVLGKRAPHSFTPPSKCGRCVQQKHLYMDVLSPHTLKYLRSPLGFLKLALDKSIDSLNSIVEPIIVLKNITL
jgi:hypothetical protein